MKKLEGIIQVVLGVIVIISVITQVETQIVMFWAAGSLLGSGLYNLFNT